MKAILSLVAILFCGAASAEMMPLPQVQPQMAMPMPMPVARPVTVVTQTTVAVPRPCGVYGSCGVVTPPPMPPTCGGYSHGCGGAGYYPYYPMPYYPRYAARGCRRGCARARRACGRGCGRYGRPAYAAKSSGWYVNLPFASFGGYSNKAIY